MVLSLDIKQFVGAILMLAIGGMILSTPLRGTIAENYQWIGYIPIAIGILYVILLVRSK